MWLARGLRRQGLPVLGVAASVCGFRAHAQVAQCSPKPLAPASTTAQNELAPRVPGLRGSGEPLRKYRRVAGAPDGEPLDAGAQSRTGGASESGFLKRQRGAWAAARGNRDAEGALAARLLEGRSVALLGALMDMSVLRVGEGAGFSRDVQRPAQGMTAFVGGAPVMVLDTFTWGVSPGRTLRLWSH